MKRVKLGLASLVLSCMALLAAPASNAMFPGVAATAGPMVYASCLVTSGPMVFACTAATLAGMTASTAMQSPSPVMTMMNPYMIALTANKPEAGFAFALDLHLADQVGLGVLTREEAQSIHDELAAKFHPSLAPALDGSALLSFSKDRQGALERFCRDNGLSALTGAYLAQALWGVNL